MGWRVQDLSGWDSSSVVPLDGELALRAEWDRLAGLSPRVVSFAPAGAGYLQVGVGGPWSFVEYVQDEPWRAEAAVSPPELGPRPGSEWYECGGQGSEIPGDYLLPAGRAVELVITVLRSGELPSSVRWESQ